MSDRLATVWEDPKPAQLIDGFYALPPLDRRRAVWWMSRETFAELHNLLGLGTRWPQHGATMLGKPIRFVEGLNGPRDVALGVRDMTIQPLRAKPKSRRAA